jgi:hypothetical protein
MIELIFIPLCAFFSRIWGGGFLFLIKDSKLPYAILRKICQFAYGFCLGFLVSDDWRVWVLCSPLFWVGEKPNWTPLFDEISGLATRNKHLYLRMAWRGLLYSAPCFLLIGLDERVLFIASMAIAFPLSGIIGYKIAHGLDKHATTELLRGAIMGVLIITLINI